MRFPQEPNRYTKSDARYPGLCSLNVGHQLHEVPAIADHAYSPRVLPPATLLKYIHIYSARSALDITKAPAFAGAFCMASLGG